MDRKRTRDCHTFIQYALAASRMAVEMAHFNPTEEEKERVGVIIGVGLGGMGPRRVSPHFIPGVIGNLAAGQVSMTFGYRGASFSTTSACASGAHGIGEAFRAIRFGAMDACVAGGGEAAIRRGVPILAEVVGYGATSDANHITQPARDGEGAQRAMRAALREAQVNIDQVHYVSAHGTSTEVGDLNELIAIQRVFGDHARGKLMVSSVKSMTGHTLGAAGALETVLTALSLHRQVVLPTLNLDDPMDEARGMDLVPHEARRAKIEIAVKNSFGFGGQNASLVLRAPS
jgi:3-oxoacyl-[acyl-carrier-protein] synthase II